MMHWLDRYATDYHRWQRLPNTPSETWYRPLGLIEGMFDRDGAEYEGRADINTLLKAELSSNISTEALREKILLAWTVLRYQHVLLSARVLYRHHLLSGAEDGTKDGATDRCFVVRKPADVDEMLKAASRTMEFVEDHYNHVDFDVEDFYTHVMNTARVFDTSVSLARFFILPLKPLAEGRFHFQAISVVAHAIADGMSIYRWHAHFLHLLNAPTFDLEAQARRLCSASADLKTRLPLAQEDIYPRIPGNKARQRWYWAITRILRHTRRPPPASFPNPLRREAPLTTAEAMPPHYPALLDYSKTPPVNTYSVTTSLSPRATRLIKTLCHNIHVSVGSAAFALIALTMMQIHEQQQNAQAGPFSPSSSSSSPTLPFVATYPINPRPFLTRPTTGTESSLIISFSDGLTLPHLPSSSLLPLPHRFTLLARQAHRQLRLHQKPRVPSPASQSETLTHPISNPTSTTSTTTTTATITQLLAQLYLYGIERTLGLDVQGLYPPSKMTAAAVVASATCGISSIGNQSGLIAPLVTTHAHHRRFRRRLLHHPYPSSPDPIPADESEGGGGGTALKPTLKEHDEGEDDGGGVVEAEEEEEEEEIPTFNFLDIRCTVRAREAEFLIGSAGDVRGLSFDISFDGGWVDRRRVVAEWGRVLQGVVAGLVDEGREELLKPKL